MENRQLDNNNKPYRGNHSKFRLDNHHRYRMKTSPLPLVYYYHSRQLSSLKTTRPIRVYSSYEMNDLPWLVSYCRWAWARMVWGVWKRENASWEARWERIGRKRSCSCSSRTFARLIYSCPWFDCDAGSPRWLWRGPRSCTTTACLMNEWKRSPWRSGFCTCIRWTIENWCRNRPKNWHFNPFYVV